MNTKISPESEPAKRYVGVVEFARLCDLSPFVVYRLVKEKKLPAFKMGHYRSPKARILINWKEGIEALEKQFRIHRP